MRKALLVIAMVATVAALTTLSRAQLLTGTVSTVGGSSSCPVYNSQNSRRAGFLALSARTRRSLAAPAPTTSTSRLAMSRRHRAHTRGPFLFFSSAGGESPGDDDLNP